MIRTTRSPRAFASLARLAFSLATSELAGAAPTYQFKQKPGHQAYTVESRPQSGTGNYTALPLRLVIIAAPGREPARVHLLVLKRDRSIERIIELHQERRA